MDIKEYIQNQYQGEREWFREETGLVYHQQRINKILELKQYIEGDHRVLYRNKEVYNGKEYTPRAVILNYIKLMIQFHATYLLNNPVTIASKDEETAKIMKSVYNDGFYDDIDYQNLENLIKFGNSYEYVYLGNNREIKSKIIPVEDSYPVYNINNELIAFIEHYVVDNIGYWNVYYEDRVEKWTNEGSDLRLISVFENLSGLPIVYKTNNELDPNFGKSEIEDVIPIIDELEFILSKFSDSFYKHHNPLFVVSGQALKGGEINPHLTGIALNLDDGAEAKMLENKLDSNSFKQVFETLKQSMLDVGSIPSISVNNAEISNVSTTAIQLMYQLADIRAGVHAKYMKRGMMERFKKFRRLLELKGIKIDDEGFNTLNVIFRTNKPMNEQELIQNMKTLWQIGGISLETIVENSPFTTDTVQEMERLKNNIGK
ncbi:hypothetical protein BSNK01_00020 [Bacillaceae bacterium]